MQKSARVIFTRQYQGCGGSSKGMVAGGGVFAMKAALRHTTTEAVKSVMDQFLRDFRAFEKSDDGAGQPLPPATPP